MFATALALLVLTCGAASVAAYEYRLAQGTSSYGRLEVRPTSSSTWGTVCDDSFGSSDATVACRSLGLSTTNAVYRSATTSESQLLTSGTPIYFDNLGCSGSESQLDLCSRASTIDCVHSEDIVLYCGAPSSTSTVPALDTSSSSYSYRLQGGQDGVYGRLEVRPTSSSTWGTVCDDSFGSSDAAVACRSLGLSTTNAVYRSATTSESQLLTSGTPIYFDNLACSGSESQLHQCSRASTIDCVHSEDIVLYCGAPSSTATVPTLTSSTTTTTTISPSSTYSYRLQGGQDGVYGRLEVRPTSSSTWGTVCDDLFGSPDAIVACRSLGLSTTYAAYRTATSSESQQVASGTPIYFDNLGCSGSESQLDLCSRASTSNCVHGEDVVLYCGAPSSASTVPTLGSISYSYRLQGGQDGVYGRLEVRPSDGAVWGTVCDDSFGSADATVACRSLGLPTTNAGYRSVTTTESGYIASSVPTYFDDLACTGSESQLSQCSRASTEDCSRSEDIVLSCSASYTTPPSLLPPGATPPAGPTPPTSGFSYRLEGGGTNYGRLEVRRTATGEWGTVCDDGFNSNAAAVACRSLGLSVSPRTYASAGSQQGGASSTPINLDDLVCSGSEASLAQCEFSTRHNCDHAEDVLIACGRDTIPAVAAGTAAPVATSSTYTYRLYGGDTPNTGRLEVRPPNEQQWGTVCDDGFSFSEIAVACRSLGLPTSPASYAPAGVSWGLSSTQPINFDDLSCSESESRLDQCRWTSTHNCIHFEDVILTCGTYQAAIEGTVRIAGDAFGELLSSNLAGLTSAVQSDIAGAVNVSTGNVTVDSLAEGSLIVNFTIRVTSTSAAESAAAVVNTFVGRSTSASFFPQTQALYSQETSSGRAGQALSVQSASAATANRVDGTSPTESPSSSSSWMPCSTACVAGAGVGILVGIAVIGGVIALVMVTQSRNNQRAPVQAFAQEGQQQPPVDAGNAVEMRPTEASGSAPALPQHAQYPMNQDTPQYSPNHPQGASGYPVVATPGHPAYPGAVYDEQQQQDVTPYGVVGSSWSEKDANASSPMSNSAPPPL